MFQSLLLFFRLYFFHKQYQLITNLRKILSSKMYIHERKNSTTHTMRHSSMLTHISFLRKFLGTGIIQNGIHEFHEAMPFQY